MLVNNACHDINGLRLTEYLIDCSTPQSAWMLTFLGPLMVRCIDVLLHCAMVVSLWLSVNLITYALHRCPRKIRLL